MFYWFITEVFFIYSLFTIIKNISLSCFLKVYNYWLKYSIGNPSNTYLLFRLFVNNFFLFIPKLTFIIIHTLVFVWNVSILIEFSNFLTIMYFIYEFRSTYVYNILMSYIIAWVNQLSCQKILDENRNKTRFFF